jgi:DNA-binding NarL/FixJ family response regulator
VTMEIAHVLRKADFEVLGPARAAASGLSLIEEIGGDAAVLDINLRGEAPDPVARKLLAKVTRFITLSGYSRTLHPWCGREATPRRCHS